MSRVVSFVQCVRTAFCLIVTRIASFVIQFTYEMPRMVLYHVEILILVFYFPISAVNVQDSQTCRKTERANVHNN